SPYVGAWPLLSGGPIRPQLFQRDLTQPPRQCVEIGPQAREVLRTLVAPLVHVKRTVDLELDGVQPGGRVAVMFGDEAASIRLVAGDAVAEPAQRRFHGLRHRP